MTTQIEEGTVIHGTLRTEALLSAFCWEIERLGGSHEVPESALENFEDPYWYTETAQQDLEEAFSTLNELAPEGMYFGAHPGDGSDFGFWKEEEEN